MLSSDDCLGTIRFVPHRHAYDAFAVISCAQEWRQENQLPDPELQMARIGARARPAGSGLVVDVNNAVGGGGVGGEGAAHRDPFLSHLRSYGL